MRRPFHIGIAPLLAVSTGIATIALTLTLVEAIGSAASKQVADDIGHSLAELAFQTTDKLDRGMYERYREVQLMADRYEITGKDVPTAVKRAVLESMQETYPYYAWIGMTDTSGRVLVSTKGMLEGVDVSQRPWYGAAYRNEHLTDVHEAVLLARLLPNPTGEPKRFFDVAFPYRDKAGNIAGILGTHLSWQWARDIEDSVLRPLARRKSVDTFIVSRGGRMLLGPDQYKEADVGPASFAASRKQKNGFVTETWPDGKRYLVGYSRSQGFRSYPGLGWTVLVRQDLEEAYRPVYELKKKVFWGGLAASLLISALLWAIARRVTGPLRTIARHAEELRLGTATHIPPVGSHLAEVDILERALNALLGDLQSKELGLLEMNATLESRVDARTEELRRAAEATRANAGRVRAIIDTALDAFVGVDGQGRITDWNPRAQETFGWARDEVLGRPVSEVIIPERLRAAHDEGMRRFAVSGSSGVVGKRLRMFALRRGGAEFPVEMTIGLIESGDGHFFGAFVQDISERTRIEEELERLARVDALTGLPNRRSYEERLQEALQRAKRSGRGLALMFLDIDYFKQINDTLGHGAGDAVLQEFARRLKASVRTTDTVSRLAGDEFTIVLEGLTDVQEAALVARKIVDALRDEVMLDGASRRVTASIGIAFVKDQATDMVALGHQADTALYQAKTNGRNGYAVF